MKLDRKTFQEQRDLRFGRANPERMRLAFWEAMVQDGEGPYKLRERLCTDSASFVSVSFGPGGRTFGPLRHPPRWLAAGLEFGKALYRKLRGQGCSLITDGGPIWNFERMGQTRTELLDGRTVCVGGEHEDHYDPDFAIYNDVVVLHPDESVEIYGYPKGVFPPTDFHTASLVGGRLIVIGCLGYPADRRPGMTPAWSLDLSSYRIEPIATHGDPPGWIYEHEAEVDAPGDAITVRGGRIIEDRGGTQVTRLNLEEYRLRLEDGRWDRITDRRAWRQYEIRRVDGEFLFRLPDVSKLTCGGPFPRFRFEEDDFRLGNIPHEFFADEDLHRFEIVVDGITIRFLVDAWLVRVIVEGTLPTDLAGRVIEAIREDVEAAVEHPCVVEPI
jgi:hypothetical protein